MLKKILGIFESKKMGILDKTLPLDKRLELAHNIFFNALKNSNISTIENRKLSNDNLFEHSKQIFFGTEKNIIKTYGEFGTQMICLELIEKIKTKSIKYKTNAEFNEMVSIYKKSINQ